MFVPILPLLVGTFQSSGFAAVREAISTLEPRRPPREGRFVGLAEDGLGRYPASPHLAGFVDGNLDQNGTVRLVAANCAELFSSASAAEDAYRVWWLGKRERAGLAVV